MNTVQIKSNYDILRYYALETDKVQNALNRNNIEHYLWLSQLHSSSLLSLAGATDEKMWYVRSSSTSSQTELMRVERSKLS